MAKRRMFSLDIVDTDQFLDMSIGAQNLYFHLGMRADDDGFVSSPKRIISLASCTVEDMKQLIVKGYVIPFESGVCVIRDWKINNYIQQDRHIETKYKEEKSLLMSDRNNAYTLETGNVLETVREKTPLTNARQKRLEAKKDSSLPYSFEYKIRNAFVGINCPICDCKMSYENDLVKPSIQHNRPISLGGKHEIDNISVICNSCNTSIQNRAETPPYNTELVKEIWERIGNVPGTERECIGNVPGMDTQVRLGKDSLELGKDRIGEETGDKVKNSKDRKQGDNNSLCGQKESARQIFNSFEFEPDLERAIKNWILYKREKGQPYKAVGLKTLLIQIKAAKEKYGAVEVVSVIMDSMASNYAGITLDKLEKKKTAMPKDRLSWIDEVVLE